MKRLFVALTLLIIPLFVFAGFSNVKAVPQETCPDGDGWVKIDSDDLSSYPVDGATDYCFKAGSDNSQGCEGGIFDEIPDGGFVQPYCGLSHWSYFIEVCDEDECEPTPTPTITISPSPTPTPTPEIRIHVSDGKAPTPTAPVCPDGSTIKVAENFHIIRSGDTAELRWIPTEGNEVNIYWKIVTEGNWQHSAGNQLNDGNFTVGSLNPALGYTFGVQQVNNCSGGEIITAVVEDPPAQGVMFRLNYYQFN